MFQGEEHKRRGERGVHTFTFVKAQSVRWDVERRGGWRKKRGLSVKGLEPRTHHGFWGFDGRPEIVTKICELVCKRECVLMYFSEERGVSLSSNSQMLQNHANDEEPLELSEQHFRWMNLDAAVEDGIWGSKIVVEKPGKRELPLSRKEIISF